MSDASSRDSERPDPEDDPFRCSICGHPLRTTKRVEGEEHCDSCLREYGPDTPDDERDPDRERPADMPYRLPGQASAIDAEDWPHGGDP